MTTRQAPEISDLQHIPNQKVTQAMNTNPDPSIPCLGCEAVPTPYRSSDGYALCAVCADELVQLEQDDADAREAFVRGDHVHALRSAEYDHAVHTLTGRGGAVYHDERLAAARIDFYRAGGSAEVADQIADEAFESAVFHTSNR